MHSCKLWSRVFWLSGNLWHNRNSLPFLSCADSSSPAPSMPRREVSLCCWEGSSSTTPPLQRAFVPEAESRGGVERGEESSEVWLSVSSNESFLTYTTSEFSAALEHHQGFEWDAGFHTLPSPLCLSPILAARWRSSADGMATLA